MEILKPKCGFISQWGLRRKNHFQGHHTAPKYHEYIPKPIQLFNSTSTDILIGALKNKRDCTALEFTENEKRQQKRASTYMHSGDIAWPLNYQARTFSSCSRINSQITKLANSGQRFAANNNYSNT